MSNEIKLEAYYIRVKDSIRKMKKGTEKRTYYHLGDIEGRDLFTIFSDFLQAYSKKYDRDKNLKKSFEVINEDDKRSSDNKKRIISGVIESGEYGNGSKIKNSTGKMVHDKQIAESVDLPFYFLVQIPKGGTRAILLVQKTGVHGIYSVLKKKFEEFVIKKYGKYKIDFSAILSKELAEKMLLNGGVKTLAFTKNVSPNDIADQLGDGFGDERLTSKGITLELIITAQGNDFLNLRNPLKAFLKDKKLKTLDVADFGFVNGNYGAQVRVKYGDSYRTIDLSENMNIKPFFSLEKEDIEKDEKNHPVFESIDLKAKEILEDILNEEK